jgi:hypothetical protein
MRDPMTLIPGESGTQWQGRYEPTEWRRGRGWAGPGLLTTGIVLLGLGALAWYYLGPDLRRYLKIKSM